MLTLVSGEGILTYAGEESEAVRNIYRVSKAAVNAFTESLALEMKSFGEDSRL